MNFELYELIDALFKNGLKTIATEFFIQTMR